ncbi:iron compound ABC transporter permease [Enterococcus sp. AZ194]|uniref:FecCD family ABC transporter permease n=1 Tax=Enterococcus sp. AZ194 TaxID=2774629 RepID=UPI003F25E660
MNKVRNLLILVILSLVVLCLGIKIGSVSIPLSDLVKILFNQTAGVDEMVTSIVKNVRLPRVLMAYLVGAGIAVSGTVMQSLLGNPLASTYTLGVSSGASLGAALIIITGVTVSFVGSLLLPATGFLFGLLTVLVVLVSTRSMDSQMSNQTVVLVGMIMTLFVGAILTMLTALYQDHLKQLVFWQMGSFSGSTWGKIQIYLPIALVSIFLLWANASSLDVLGLGEEQAMMAGVEVKKTKFRVILLSTLLAGSAVSFVGVIGFVDLVAPHVVRRFVGSTHRWLIIGSALLGGILMVVGDLISRTLLSPKEIPIGAVTALIGAPFFMYVYFRKRGQEG